MNQLILLLCVALLTLDGPVLAETAPGRVTGGRAHALPDWFKPSFLNFKDDIDEARQAGKFSYSWISMIVRIVPARLKRTFVRAKTCSTSGKISM